MMKLWQKSTTQLDDAVEQFTIGRDRELDLHLARYDVAASIAHAQMLGKTGIISADESTTLIEALEEIAQEIERGTFRIEDGVEDIHSQLELLLVRRLGPIGEKIHTARSRNDQVLTAIALYARDRLERTAANIQTLVGTMLAWAARHREILMPGLTHMQAAMPTTFALWMSSFAESLLDDGAFATAAGEIAAKNPLGTAAGYGSSFPIDRRMTTALLGFRTMVASPAAAQLLRGKIERACATALAAYSATLGRLAMDVVLFLSPGYQFLRLPPALTTGSSIMPHKQNPDVFELLRARFNRVQAVPTTIGMVTINLPSGYHRDYQVLKELLLPAWDEFDECVAVLTHVLPHLEPTEGIVERAEYRGIWSVERVHERMRSHGETFRAAYRAVAESAENIPAPQQCPAYLRKMEQEALEALGTALEHARTERAESV